ncbi:HNH endonuclease [Priestia megaterium]|uniref:HNH endonuclease n=1 Tax=Priestia megaterium TaxID=1404 RepID=UPI002D7EED57|nr:HNH endonuclease [Priestia megaterium]MEB4860612.1 HNH endonuclease [Priestia megaterium]
MPHKSPKICNTEECRELTYTTYCDKCRKDNHREYKEQRVDKKEQAFYSSLSWINLRNRKKRKNPLCEVCLEEGRLTPVEIVHHLTEVKDDWSQRLSIDNLQSVCKAHHHKIHFSVDGKKYTKLKKVREPMKDSKVTIVNGASGSGKTTYVQDHIEHGDLVIDIDYLWMAVTMLDMYDKPQHLTDIVLAMRNEACRVLQSKMDKGIRAWIITTAKDVDELKRMFNAEVITLDTGRDKCIERILSDTRRVGSTDKHIGLVNQWYGTE